MADNLEAKTGWSILTVTAGGHVEFSPSISGSADPVDAVIRREPPPISPSVKEEESPGPLFVQNKPERYRPKTPTENRTYGPPRGEPNPEAYERFDFHMTAELFQGLNELVALFSRKLDCRINKSQVLRAVLTKLLQSRGEIERVLETAGKASNPGKTDPPHEHREFEYRLALVVDSALRNSSAMVKLPA